jgi:hypothetical protein
MVTRLNIKCTLPKFCSVLDEGLSGIDWLEQVAADDHELCRTPARPTEGSP